MRAQEHAASCPLALMLKNVVSGNSIYGFLKYSLAPFLPQDVPLGGSSIKLYTGCSSMEEGRGGLDLPSTDL